MSLGPRGGPKDGSAMSSEEERRCIHRVYEVTVGEQQEGEQR